MFNKTDSSYLSLMHGRMIHIETSQQRVGFAGPNFKVSQVIRTKDNGVFCKRVEILRDGVLQSKAEEFV
jgi:hypothetical protein